MAGTINLSLSQQLDEFGEPLSEGRLYFYQAGTVSTPQNAFYDSALTLPLPNPYILDAAGRIPFFFLEDGSIKVVLIDRNGTIQITADNVPVIGSSSGGGGGGTVDPTTVLQTGWLQPIYGTGTRSGFVRANGRTIGSATSGATERANADTQALFLFLYSEDPNLTVSGGRGASAAADWAANKTIALPDWRGRAIAGLDDMGNSASGRLTLAFFSTSPTVLGNAGGSQTSALETANLPPYTPAGSIVTTTVSTINASQQVQFPDQGGGKVEMGGTSSGGSFQATNFSSTSTFTGTAQGGTQTPFRSIQPTMLATIYIKL